MKTFRIKSGHAVRPVIAIVLLLLQSTPVMIFAQQTGDYQGYQIYSANLLTLENPNTNNTFDPRTGQKVHVPGWKARGPEACSPAPGNPMKPDSPVPLQAFEQVKWGASDKFNLFSMGMDPATLKPEGVDLDIFPSFPISDKLVLRPVLAFSEHSILSRRGDLIYSPPKRWRNHYGELVQLLANTADMDKPIGTPHTTGGQTTAGYTDTDPDPDPDLNPVLIRSSRDAVAREIQTYFVNAQGQEVGFYPDPDSFPTDLTATANPDIPNNEGDYPTIRTWYSEQSNMKLEDLGSSDTFDFRMYDPSGLVYHLEHYKSINGQNIAGTYKPEYLSVHYRVHKITDPYGNEMRISFINDNALAPAEARTYDHQGNHHRTITYTYDGQGRLSKIRVPAYGGGTQDFDLYYPDQANDQNLALASSGASHWRDGSSTTVSVVDGRLFFEPVSRGLGSFSGPTVLNVDLKALQENLSLPVRYPLYDAHEALGSDSWYFKLSNFVPGSSPGSGNCLDTSSIYRLGVDGRISNQQKPVLNGVIPDQLISATLRQNSRNVVAPRLSGDPTFPDSILIESLDGGLSEPTANVCIDIFPVIKNGDLVIAVDQENQHLATLTVEDPFLASPHERVGFNPMSVQFSGTLPASYNRLIHVRRDNRERVAEIAFPASLANGGTKKRMRFTYDDQTINHQELRSIEILDDSLIQNGQATCLQKTDYLYERLQIVPGTEEDMSDLFPHEEPDFQGFCRLSNIRRFNGNDCNSFLVKGLVKGRLQEMDVLRRKTISFVEHNSDGSLTNKPNRELVTHYGGAYRFTLAGDSLGNVFHESPGTGGGGTGGPERCAANRDCHMVMWALNARPFDFTWEIHPNGSASIFDLDPTGTDLDPMLAYANKGSRPFKTYDFDTNFLSTIRAQTQANGSDMLDPLQNPYHHYQPLYIETESSSHMAQNPTFPASHPMPTLENIFNSWEATTRCHRASINSFQPVPMYKYNLETDATNGANFFRRHVLKTLHGRMVSDEIVCDTKYYRTSAVKYLYDHLNETGADLSQQLMKGRLSTGIEILKEDGSTIHEDIQWSLGGRVDLGNYMSTYEDRQKTHKLQPFVSLQLARSGYEDLPDTPRPSHFAWNTSTQSIEFSAADVVKVTRKSNGGLLHEVAASDLDKHSAGDVNFGSWTHPSLSTDDVFYAMGRYYRITSTSSGIQFSPALHKDITGSVKFYRYFNPDWSTGSVANAYQGYDAFGNSSYEETYTEDGLTWMNDPQRCFVPEMDAAQASAIQWNDSTEPDNNNTQSWNYFGRVKHQFKTGSKAFDVYGHDDELDLARENMTNPSQYWFHTHTTFDPTWPDKPVETVEYLMPYVSDNQMPWALTSRVVPAGDDRVVRFQYFPATENSMARGQLRTRWSFNAGETSHFSVATYSYDAEGRVASETKAAFDSQSPSYGLRTTLDRDVHIGIPQSTTIDALELTYTLDSNQVPQLVENTQLTMRQKTTHADHDLLGRPIRTWELNGQQQLHGPVIHHQYESPLKQIRTTTTALNFGSDQVAREVTFQDGMGRESLRLSHAAPGTFYYGSGTVYTLDGRPQKVYFEKEFDIATVTSNNKVVAKDNYFVNGSYTQTLFDDRGEIAGSVIHDVGLESQTWSYQIRDGGQGVQYTLVHDIWTEGSGELARYNIKKETYNNQGELLSIQDFEVDGVDAASAVFVDPVQAQDYLLAFHTQETSLAPLMAANYSFDRMGNVVHTQIGSQQRSFRYDRFSRLREEIHPEMGVVVTYGNFDRHGNPRSETADDPATTLVDREIDYTYDANGNMLTASYSQLDGEASILDSWTYTDVATHAFPGLVETVATIQNGSGVAYRYEYDQGTGVLLRKHMVHNLDGFSGIGTVSDISNIDWNQASPLSLEYRYDFQSSDPSELHLGRVNELVYPFAPSTVAQLGAQSHLTYAFSEANPMLVERIHENRLGTDLIEDVGYVTGKEVANYRFRSMGRTRSYRASLERDNQNRINKRTFQLPDSLEITRDYEYDVQHRIVNASIANGETFAFHYDSLGQLKSATVPGYLGSDVVSFDFDYTYDSASPGNLISFQKAHNGSTIAQESWALDPNTNRFSGSGFKYNVYGELTEGPIDGDTYTLTYNPKGRLSSYEKGSWHEFYFYDPMGMRIWADRNGEKTLYFYDENNMALTEWRSDPNPRWEKHSIYLDGQTAITLEWDQQAAENLQSHQPQSNPITSMRIPPPRLITDNAAHSLIRWGQVVDATSYDLEIEKRISDAYQPALKVTGIKGHQYTPQLDLGTYRVRVRAENGFYGPWEELDVLDASLLALYQMDGNAQDSTNNNNGTAINAQTVPGVINQALRFLKAEGAHVYVANPSDLPIGNQPRTYMGWIKLDLMSQVEHTFFEYGPDHRDFGNRVRLQIDKKGFIFDVGWDPIPIPMDVSIESWHHVALTFDGTLWKLYYDGNELFSDAANVSTQTAAGPLYLGKANPEVYNHDYCHCSIDGFEIHDRVLSATEIANAAVLLGGNQGSGEEASNE